MNRAYSVLAIKAVDDDARVITGLASTPTPDRIGDIVKPEGAKYALPLPLLWQHRSDQPIGHVTKAKVTKQGIEISAQIAKGVSEEIDRAWALIKAGLVRGLSIGFRGIDVEQIPNSWGEIFNEWEWLELSAVTIPANAEATIQTVKQFDTNAPAATGHAARSTIPPAPGKTATYRPKEGIMKNIGARIAELEEARKVKAERMTAIQSTALDAGRAKDEAEQKEFDELRAEVKNLDAELRDLRDVEALTVAPTAKDVDKGNSNDARRTVPATPKEKAAPGIRFAQLIKVRAVARLESEPKVAVAEKMYGRDSEIAAIFKAGEQVPGSTVSATWGYDLISQEGAIAADFAEYLRPATILGKFGQGNVPALRSVPFRKPLILQTGGAVGNWVGEGKPKPVDQLDFDRSVLAPLKCATIVVLTEENVRDSSPSSDMIVRDDLRNALAQLEDEAFIDPTNAGSAGIKPAGILYAAGSPNPNAIAAESYSDESDVIVDIRSLLQRYINANNPAGSAVLIMEEGTALAAGLILNALGQRAFPGIGMRGGELQGIPVITSENVTAGVVSIVNASDVLAADDGEVAVDMSREASVEMKDSGNITQSGIAGTGASLVSLWQNNLVGIRAEHTINWKARRSTVGAYLTGVAWGGAVNVS